jgi:hypothetical protein
MISDDEYLERLVAGIHGITTSQANVCWNEEINGRQFDVTVRFRQGTLQYLALVEVKNKIRKASAQDIDAFVTKSRDQKANKSVFVTAAGFQTGAIEVAKRHGIDLFTISFDDRNPVLAPEGTMVALRPDGVPPHQPLEFKIGEPQLIANIEAIRLTYSDGHSAELPNEPSQMEYYTCNTKFEDGRSIRDLINENPVLDLSLYERRCEIIRLTSPQTIIPPDEFFFRRGPVVSISTEMTGRMGRGMSGNVRFASGSFTSPIIYTNALTCERFSFSIPQLPLSFEKVKAGQFYFLQHPLRYYYCETITGDSINWILVESFQHAAIFQARFTQEAQYAHHLIRVRDKNVIARLRHRLDDFRKLPGERRK